MNQLTVLSDAEVKELFGELSYRLLADGSQIEIAQDWLKSKIKSVYIPQLKGKPTYGGICGGNVQFNVKGHERLQAAFTAVEEAGLTRDIIFWGGSFNPRLIRGSSDRVSRHSWGIAFDLNPRHNPLGREPAPLNSKGSVLRLVPLLAKHGFAWGGNFPRRDAMHFEFCRTKNVLPEPQL